MQTYQKRNRRPSLRDKSAPLAAQAAAPSMDALRAGLAQPSSGQPGQETDLPSQIQARLERALGLDFSGLQAAPAQAAPAQAASAQPAPAQPAPAQEEALPVADDSIDWAGVGETAADKIGDFSSSLDPKSLHDTAKSLRGAPVLKKEAKKLGSVVDNIADSDVTKHVRQGMAGVGVGKFVYDTIQLGRKAEEDDGEHAVDNFLDSQALAIDGAQSIFKGMDAFGLDLPVDKIAPALNGAKATIQLAKGGVHHYGHRTDKIEAQNANRDLKKNTSVSEKTRQTLTSALNAQMDAANTHMLEDKKEMMDAGFDLGGAVLSAIPGVGTAGSIGATGAKYAADAAMNHKIDSSKKDNRRNFLGQAHQDERQDLTATMMTKAQEKLGRELSHQEQEKIRYKVKHAHNERHFGKGNVTNKQAAAAKTKETVDTFNQQMAEDSEDGRAVLSAMRTSGHALTEDNQFLDTNETMGRFNADLTGQDFDTFQQNAAAHQLEKDSVVNAQRAKSQAKQRKKAEKAAAKQKKKAEKDALKHLPLKDRLAAQYHGWKADRAQKKADQQQEAQRKAEEARIRKKSKAEKKRIDKSARAKEEADWQAYQEQNRPENYDSMNLWARHKAKKAMRRQFEGKDERIKVKDDSQKGFFRKTWDTMVRRHDRARDSIVNDDFASLDFTDKASIFFQHPLAVIAAHTKGGKAKTQANNELYSMLNDELGTEMDRRSSQEQGPEQPESSDSLPTDQLADPSLLSVDQKIQRYNTGTAGNDKVEPSILPFRSKIAHLSQLKGIPPKKKGG